LPVICPRERTERIDAIAILKRTFFTFSTLL
jgi:hypothetical protein